MYERFEVSWEEVLPGDPAQVWEADEALLRVYGREIWGDPTTIALHLFEAEAGAAPVERAWKEPINSTEAVA